MADAKIMDPNFSNPVQSLLDTLNDKDEEVKATVESALLRISEKRTDDLLQVLCTYKKNTPKMTESSSAVILRVIEFATISHLTKIEPSTIQQCIDLSVSELIKTTDYISDLIQKPAQEILVAIVRHHYCKEVMEALSKHLLPNQPAHFMILHCMGALATATNDIIGFIKPTMAVVLPTLGMIRQDHVKQSHAFAIGRFCEAFTEYETNLEESDKETPLFDMSTEVSIAYDILRNQWLGTREPKLCADILNALSSMFPLLPFDKINEQSTKIVPLLINLSRRNDRLAVTQFLATVIKTLIKVNPKALDSMSDMLCNSLFDLVCVSPDYEKPQTVKGHYEALRCFDLMSEIYSEKIMEMLLIQLRSNNERERIKALLVITHLVSTNDVLVQTKVDSIVLILRSMLSSEKSIKIRMILLKTIVAFIQKGFLKDREFIKFLIRNCCRLVKPNTEHGSHDEYEDFHQACCKSMFILSSTVGMIDDLLKVELLQHFLNIEYTDACCTIAKCLSNLFGKNPEIVPLETFTDDHEEEVNLQNIPCPESIFVRSLALLGNFGEHGRIVNILNFLKNYCPNLKKHLAPLWNDKIPGLLEELRKNDESIFDDYLFEFLTLTVKDLDDPKFAEILVNKLTDQMSLYPGNTGASNSSSNAQQCEFKMPSMLKERGMLLKLMGYFLCHVSDQQTVDAKIDLIIATVKAEKIDKNSPSLEFENSITVDASKALGYASRIHFDQLMKKILNLIIEDGPKKSSSGFFSNLHFIKDSQKETEVIKMRILIISSFGYIVESATDSQILKHIDEKMADYLCRQLLDSRYFAIKQMILETFLNVAKILLAHTEEQEIELKLSKDLLKIILKIPMEAHDFENVSLLPLILKLATALLQLEQEKNDEDFDMHEIIHTACAAFFQIAQHLKSKFQSPQEDELNSFLAKHLNLSLPELNLFIKTSLETNPSPSCLDDIISILDGSLKHGNSEVRICAGHVLNASLEAFIKTVKIGCEAPSKFNQTGIMLGKIIPRCIDTNATVRHTSVEIIKRILEIACIYETLTIPDHNVDWIMELQKIKGKIITDDSKEIYDLANALAKIIAGRLSSLQHIQFTKQLLCSVDDPEQSSAIGASVVLKFFIQLKGGDMFHAIPELNKDCLAKLKHCEIQYARSGILKALVALTKHHPKIMCNEMLAQPLPFEASVIEYWHHVSNDAELSGVVLEYFLAQLSSSCLYDTHEKTNEKDKGVPHVAAFQPFAIICALHAIFQRREVDFRSELKKHFAEIFSMLLTFLAVYTNVAPPTNAAVGVITVHSETKEKPGKSKFGFSPNKDLVKQNPCQIVLDTFRLFLDNLQMEQVSSAFNMCPHMGSSLNLGNFIEILTPLSVALINHLTINSSALKELVTVLAKYIPSPYDGQRIAAIGMYAQLVPLRPCGEISSVIVLHLNSSLNDPNPLVRGLCIRGLSFVGSLTEHDSNKYSEMSLAALLKGIDDSNSSENLINIPLDSMRGVSRLLKCLPSDKLELFHISLLIRIRPFLENQSLDIREVAIVLFGDLCHQVVANSIKEEDTTTVERTSEAFREQLYANLFSMLLHLCENDQQIVHACKVTLRNICELLACPKVQSCAQKYLNEYGTLHYEMFINEFVRLIGEELMEHVPDFIDSCSPFLKSQWFEIRGNAAIVLGILSNFYSNQSHHTSNSTVSPQQPDQKEHHLKSHQHSHQAQQDVVCNKISHLLKDENVLVRVKAAEALGYIFGGV